MKIYRGRYISDLYRQILDDLLNKPEHVSRPRDLEVRETLNCVIEVQEPDANLYRNPARSSQDRYVAAEMLWYFCGFSGIGFIKNYTKGWNGLTNENGEVNSAYGNLIFTEKNEHGYTQYQWAIESLKKDRDTRQAFMHFNKPKHQYMGNRDQVCTMGALFHIRENRLHMTLNMRSNDAILGFATDFTFFNVLHQHACLHLKKYYPELEMGPYTHISHSMHLYEKHYGLVEDMLSKSFTPDRTPTMNTPIVDETGSFDVAKYPQIHKMVVEGTKENLEKTDNDVLNWCIDKINEIKPQTKSPTTFTQWRTAI